jgi:hypothetical protein
MPEKSQKFVTTGKPVYIGDSMPSELLKTVLSRPPAKPESPAKTTTTPSAKDGATKNSK